MATFVWDPTVQWPPPANILLNYDVVSPGGETLSRMRATERGDEAMTTVVKVFGGYLEVEGGGGAGSPPGIWGGGNVPMPTPPIYIPIPGPPVDGGEPSHPIYIPVYPAHPIAPGGIPGYPSHPIAPGGEQPSHPIAPGGQPPGFWGGEAPPHPDQGLPPGGETIPPDELPLPEPPEEHADDLIVAIHKPGGEWEVSAYDVQPDQGQPQPTPQRRGR